MVLWIGDLEEGICVGKSRGNVGKVGQSGVWCGGFCVNEYNSGFSLGFDDSMDWGVGSGEKVGKD